MAAGETITNSIAKSLNNDVKEIMQKHKKDNENKDLTEIFQKYHQQFKLWLKKAYDVQAIIVKGDILEINTSAFADEQLKREGYNLLTNFQKDFGLNIRYLLVSDLQFQGKESNGEAYLNITMPKEINNSSLLNFSNKGKISVNTKNFEGEKFERQIVLNTKDKVSEKQLQDTNELLDLYDNALKNDINEVIKMISPNLNGSIGSAELKKMRYRQTRDGKPSINRGFAAEAIISARLTKEHIQEIYEYYEKYMGEQNGNKTNEKRVTWGYNGEMYSYLGWNKASTMKRNIIRMIRPDFASFVSKGDFEYHELNMILLYNGLINDMMKVSNSNLSINLQKIKARIKLYDPIKLQIKAQSGGVSLDTIASYIYNLDYLISQGGFEILLKNLKKEEIDRVINSMSSVAGSTYIKNLVYECIKEVERSTGVSLSEDSSEKMLLKSLKERQKLLGANRFNFTLS